MNFPITLNDRQIEMLTRISNQRASVGNPTSLQAIVQAAFNRGLRDEHDDSLTSTALLKNDFDSLAFLARQVS